MNIQWFPGHMTKTRRMIENDIKLVDAVVEITDARCPEAGRNPILGEIIKNKPCVIILNKCDYADKQITDAWKKNYEKKGLAVLICDCRSGKGVKGFIPLLKTVLSELLKARREKGTVGKKLRVMVVGIPNVGKSSFINRMANSKKTLVGDRPGVTRGKQWVTIDKEIELLDMPGILWPKFDDEEIALKLAYTGAIKDQIMETELLALKLGRFLLENYPKGMELRYNIDNSEENILEKIAVNRGMIMAGGIPDILRAATTLLDEFRGGKIGKISLERPI